MAHWAGRSSKVGSQNSSQVPLHMLLHLSLPAGDRKSINAATMPHWLLLAKPFLKFPLEAMNSGKCSLQSHCRVTHCAWNTIMCIFSSNSVASSLESQLCNLQGVWPPYCVFRCIILCWRSFWPDLYCTDKQSQKYLVQPLWCDGKGETRVPASLVQPPNFRWAIQSGNCSLVVRRVMFKGGGVAKGHWCGLKTS